MGHPLGGVGSPTGPRRPAPGFAGPAPGVDPGWNGLVIGGHSPLCASTCQALPSGTTSGPRRWCPTSRPRRSTSAYARLISMTLPAGDPGADARGHADGGSSERVPPPAPAGYPPGYGDPNAI